MNPSSYNQLRWCDRYKSNLIYTHVEALAKKIRKRKKFDNSMPINATSQQKQIDVFYKEGWQYEHAHSSLSCDISNPLYIQQHPSTVTNEELAQYYTNCQHFIQRLKSQHQDQTAFRVDAQYVRPVVAISSEDWLTEKYSKEERRCYQNALCAKEVYYNFVQVMEKCMKQIVNNVEKCQAMYSQFDDEEYGFQRVKDQYVVILSWLEALKGQYNSSQTMQEWLSQQHAQQITSIHTFTTNFLSTLSTMSSTNCSSVLNHQPRISVLTHLIHPILLSLLALLHKQQITWENEYEHDQFTIDYGKKIEDGVLLEDKNHHEISKVLLINFDGYQSQFNVEMARNMGEHVMYVSFPIFGTKDAEGEGKGDCGKQKTRDLRFYKKIMFNSSREMYEFQNQQFDVIEDTLQQPREMDEEDIEELNIRKKLQLQYNPQKYYQQISKIYKQKHLAQSNKNIYILPLQFPYLETQHLTHFSSTSTSSSITSSSNSYFIHYMLHNFLLDSFRKFNPTHIVISYSGRIQICQEHWVSMLQELARISKRKMMLFINFTAKFTRNLEDEYQYDNFVELGRDIGDSCDIGLMKKVSQFLKISSGTYNLERPELMEPVIPRYKLAKLNGYIRGLLSALAAEEYPQLKNRCQDIFLRIDSIVINRSMEQNKKEIKSAIPQFYQELFRHIRYILLGQTNKFPSYLMCQVQKLRKEIKILSKTFGSSHESRQKCVDQVLRQLELSFASQKVSQVAYIYLKSQPDRLEFQQLKEEIKDESDLSDPLKINGKITNNLQDLYCLSLRYTTPNKDKQALTITPTTQLLYRENQTYKYRNNLKKTANLLYMNNLKNNQFTSYAGLVTLSKSSQTDRNKNKISNQRVEMFPIVFTGVPTLEYDSFTIRSAWNYAETGRYYFLFWPTEYNLLEAKLAQLSGQPYQPRILPQIYISEIPQTKQHRLTFSRAALTDPNTIPRRFCSILELIEQDKIIILGGFYEKEHNYLSLQTEITGLDLEHYESEGGKCVVTNDKGVLYELGKKQAKDRNNSYVRARREYQIFELEELCELREQEIEAQNQVKTYIMLGGYGQDFTRPYSLMTYNYYQIKVDMRTKSIQSIQRKMLYERLLTVNLRGFVKNNGFFDKMSFYDKGVLKPNQKIGPDMYIAHRSVYSLLRQEKDGSIEQQLQIKIKYLFAIDLYNPKPQYQKLAIRIGQHTDPKTSEISQFLLCLSKQGHHYLTILKNKPQPSHQHEHPHHQQIVPILLQKHETKTSFQNVPLTHGSIVSIDAKFMHVCAIVKHDFYTNGKFVLAQCEIPSQQAEVVLRIVQVFEENLEQYFLFVPRPTEVLFLHGVTFSNVLTNDFSFRIAKKQGGKEQPKKKIASSNTIDPTVYKKIYTTMIKDQNKDTKTLQIQQLSLLLPHQPRPQSYTLLKHRLKLSLSNPDFTWQQYHQSPLQFLDEQTNTIIHIVRIQGTRIIHPQQENQGIFYSFTSPILASLYGHTQGAIMVIKIYAYNRKYYLGVLNFNNNVKLLQEDCVKFIVVNVQHRDAKKIWDMGVPIIHHIKSLNKYQDMQIL